MRSLGRRFDRKSSSVSSLISPTWWHSSTGSASPPRRRALFLNEKKISRWLSLRRSLRLIARHLGRLHRPAFCEVSHQWSEWTATGLPDQIRPPGIELRACASHSWACHPFLRRTISIGLRRQWSPEQIAGWLKRSISGGATKSGVTRDDLSQPVHPASPLLKKRAALST